MSAAHTLKIERKAQSTWMTGCTQIKPFNECSSDTNKKFLTCTQGSAGSSPVTSSASSPSAPTGKSFLPLNLHIGCNTILWVTATLPNHQPWWNSYNVTSTLRDDKKERVLHTVHKWFKKEIKPFTVSIIRNNVSGLWCYHKIMS